MKKKTFTEEEILEHINHWRDVLVEGAWSTKKCKYEEHDCCGQDGVDIGFTKRNFEALVLELKQKFMTPQGFRRAIEKAGLMGFKFPDSHKTNKEKNGN